jgi:serine/threonine protein kinase
MPQFPATLDQYPRRPLASLTAPLIDHLCSALSFLHSNELVHLDVKPANIFIDRTGGFLLGDFGSIKPISDFCTESFISCTSQFVPSDLPISASTAVDWYMLAVTVLFMASVIDLRGGRHTTNQVRLLLIQLAQSLPSAAPSINKLLSNLL